MELTMQKIDLKNIDKSNWKTFRFDQIARKISEPVDPSTTSLSIYVGLEHLDAESIHIKRFGEPSDVSGGKLKCYPGDIIFGKRRAYQRKASIVNFEGICSAHAFVLRAIPEVIDPRLFLFFLHSDLFMHCAVDISVGGLSPTINWGQLKEQEFLLPPKDQQARLAELLWAMDDVIEKEINMLNSQETLFLSISNEIFTKSKGAQKKLKDVGELIMGQSPPGSSYNENGEGFPFLQGNAEFGNENPTNYKYTTAPNKIAPQNSILISVRAPVGDLNIADKDYCIGRGLAAIKIEDLSLRNYVYNFLKYSKVELEKKSTGSTFKAVNRDILSSLILVVPNKEELVMHSNKMDNTLNSHKLIELKVESSRALLKSLINQIF
jgi:type I restriction enzyme S subunit